MKEPSTADLPLFDNPEPPAGNDGGRAAAPPRSEREVSAPASGGNPGAVAGGNPNASFSGGGGSQQSQQSQQQGGGRSRRGRNSGRRGRGGAHRRGRRHSHGHGEGDAQGQSGDGEFAGSDEAASFEPGMDADAGDAGQGGSREKRREVPAGPAFEGEGLLEVSSKGFGFLRLAASGFKQAPNDIFVTPEMVRSFGLRDGMWIKGMVREGQRGPQLCELAAVCGKNPEEAKSFPYFEELTAINPNKRIILETRSNLYTTRVVDLITPIGRGQRGLIVAPPRTGKTTLLQQMAEAVHHNHDAMKIFVLLVDERPEEVTELTRALPFAEVMASSNDQEVKSHTRIAQLAIERAKRLVEAGEHVFLLLDSITRLARAFNNSMKNDKRGISKGGLAVGALEMPRRLFAAARNTREAGSLTIVGTALVQTNSKMDESIFQEFKGTGNLELVLDRKIAEQYVWPAVNIHASGTRREELLLPKHHLEKIHVIRRGLAGHKPVEAIQRLLSLMERFPNNAQMMLELKASAA